MFIFASTEPSGFPAAIRSRLQRYDVRRLSVPEIEGKLRRILDADGRRADDDAIRLIATLAAGGMRDAELMLDQLMSSASSQIDEAQVRDLLGLADAEVVDAFVDLLIRGDAPAGVALLDGLDERGRDIGALLDQVVDAIRLELVSGLTESSGARHDPNELASAGRRIAAIDPNRAGIGGLRFQLELALFRTAGELVGRISAVKPAKPAANGQPGDLKDDAGVLATNAPTSDPSVGTRRLAKPPAPAPTPKPPATVSEAESPTAEEPAAPLTAGTRLPTRDKASSSGGAHSGGEVGRDPAPSGPGLDALLMAWPGIVAQLSLHPPTRPLILGLPAGRGRRRGRDPRIPGGAGVSQGCRGAAEVRDRGRDLRRAWAADRGPMRRRERGSDRDRPRRRGLRPRRGPPDLRRRSDRRRRGPLS